MESKEKFIDRISKVNSGFHISQEYMCLEGVKNMLTMKPARCVSQTFEGITKCNFLKENFSSRIISKWELLSGKTEREQTERDKNHFSFRRKLQVCTVVIYLRVQI